MDEMDSEPISAREEDQSQERAEDDVDDMGFMDQNMANDPDYNFDALESVHFEVDERGKKHEHFPEFNKKTNMKNPTLHQALFSEIMCNSSELSSCTP